MKLVFDHNLPPRLARGLADLFPESQHVYPLDLARASDQEICDFAQQRGFAVVTKDADFVDIASRSPLKVIWIRRGNCSVEEVADLLRQQAGAILALGEDEQVRVLVLF